MQASQIPAKFPITFASSAGSGYIRTIPQTPSGTPGQASLQQGFPPENFNPVAAGGVPPFGQDFNGILNQISAWSQWMNAGGAIPYDGSFQTSIGGYPKGAIVESGVSAGAFWLSTADNNLSDPDTGGSNWLPINFGGQTIQFAADSGVANALAVANIVPVQSHSLNPGFIQAVLIAHTNTTTATLNVDGTGAKAIVNSSGVSIGTGQLPSGGLGVFMLDNSNQYRLLATIPQPGASTPYAPKLIGFVANQAGAAATSVPTSVATVISFGNTAKNNLYGTSTFNGTTLTIGTNEAGIWNINSAIHIPAQTIAAFQQVGIWQNGAQVFTGTTNISEAATGSYVEVSANLVCNAGDTIQILFYHQYGFTISTGNDATTNFSALLISAY